jgi:TnpA family transposase
VCPNINRNGASSFLFHYLSERFFKKRAKRGENVLSFVDEAIFLQ